MVILRRRVIDNTIEDKILTGMIISTRFCRDIERFFRKEYLLTTHAQTIARWCLEYYKKYKEAPAKKIQDIYFLEKQNIKEADGEIISSFLSKLSTQLEQEESFNEDYILDKGKEYFKKRSLSITTDNVKALLELNKINDAEKEIQKYREIAAKNSGWIDPFLEKEVKAYFQDEQDKSHLLFRMPGALGDLIGDLERGWLFSIFAPVKRGKCIMEGSLIPLSNGLLKPIEKIVQDKTDKETFSLDDSGKIVRSEIIDYFDNGEKECFRVRTRTGRVINTTKNHPLFTIKGWVQLKDIQPGIEIAVPKEINCFGQMSLNNYKVKILAYIIAEGGVTTYATTFSNGEKEIRDDFEDCVIKMGDKIRYHKTDNFAMEITKISNQQKGIKNTDKPTLTNRWLKEINFKRGLTKEKEIPEIVFLLTKENLILFLSILFSCDGTIYKSGNSAAIGYSSSSIKLIYQIQHLLLRFGIFGKIRKSIFKGFISYEWVVEDRNNVLKFIDTIGFVFSKQIKALELRNSVEKMNEKRGFLDRIPFVLMQSLQEEIGQYLFKNNLFWHSKGFEPFKLALNNHSKINKKDLYEIGNIIQSQRIINISNSHFLWDSIISIESIGMHKTYDLTIKNYHNFIADDIFVHNSFWLQEIAIQATLDGLKTLLISLEMGAHSVKRRVYKRITAQGDQSKTFIYPCFDCIKNQDDSCRKSQRTNDIKLLGESGDKPEYDDKMKYKPCFECRGSRDFIVGNWYITESRDKMKLKTTTKKVKGLRDSMLRNHFRFQSYPAFSANLSQIRADIEELEYTDNFIPDVIVIDYPDILAPEDSRIVGRERIDDTWKTLKNLASTRHCLVVVASQTNRGSFDKRNVVQTDAAEDIRKLAHVDAAIALNQLPNEKRENVTRVALIAERDGEFDQFRSCLVLQQLELGQTCLDSELIK